MLNDMYLRMIHGQQGHAKKLNDKQIDAVFDLTSSCLALVASPGSGKTLALSAKICHLLKNGFKPCEILAITFTRKAAEGFILATNATIRDEEPHRERCKRRFGFERDDHLQLSPSLNFLEMQNDKLCLRILRENHARLGFEREVNELEHILTFEFSSFHFPF